MHKLSIKGFSLIELVVAIVLIAILGIISLPRFFNFTENSRAVKIEQLKSQFQDAINFAHARWAVNGRASSEINDLPGYGLDADGNAQLDMNDEGYPLGIDKNNPMGAPYNIGRGHNGCIGIWEALMNSDFLLTTNRNNYEGYDFVTRRQNLTFITKEGNTVTALAVCYYIYTHSGYNRNPNEADYVLWYNSRTGEVSTTEPN